MEAKGFRKAGHAPSLLSAFLYFDVSFMIWVLCGALSLYITKDFGLSDTQKAAMVAIPILGGSIFRIPMGILADRIGSKKAGLLGMFLTIIPLLWGWLGGTSLLQMHMIGFLLGFAGASFAVSLSLASRWYPPQYQGLAMGIAGAGNSGTALATFFGPQIAQAYGWHSVFGIALIPLVLVMIVFALLAKDAPNAPAPKPLKSYLSVFKHADTWWFSMFYAITFGGFVGFANYASIFFYDVYGDGVHSGGLTKVQVGYLVTITVIAGSFFRPLGGWIADRIGGMRLLLVLYAVVSVCAFAIASMPSSFLVMLLYTSVMMACLGMGNGSVFQIIPQRFSSEIGVITGIVGAAGGLGGYLLPTYVLGPLKQSTGSQVTGFLVVGSIVLLTTLIFYAVTRSWKKSWAKAESGVNF
ncbi:NarK/NasA family nitrate transporter [Paenibacillus sonchi]|uniref:NarK/NasA family nitrate transporter n=3 Tax=Paenibacillus sonchi group TaxID=2044880 RepID=A0A974PEL7_9BACL|nr:MULTISPECIES: nitrate/nitrite transporter [Paenibacillus sonchi group]KWX69430.1 MFS transporter [Paenibacillus riograndensis]MCE3203971.1 NarK/NasA family nitrate transporter [Paenibacillus sonchi]QQZ62459.1 NarK/NasA family nitrate transporter [Paenibacillus sonchi]CQR58951.1 Nitrate transporter [Paenibacillus riograndensis SBR5]